MGKIYAVDFEDKKDKTETMAELFDSIQLYREQGKSLSKIFSAFTRSGLWNKSWSSFSNEYYQYRNQIKTAARTDKSKQFKDQEFLEKQKTDQLPADVDGSNVGPSDAEADLQVDTRTGIKPDMTLAEKREISARLFRQRNQ
ncbi:MAG: hypothetical protein HLUCCA11_21250 [Phormidesmis priestleyi Ana]|uniref:Uncharacterized protein n=1 Tax=Phormidesmis priestleyi Ana TaxID=1666911 RepID=A0A0P8BUP6_9CYAN|nr:MAG: hypothetical protein HLUCCA11_21250 [Phormidesmis priestleyi Ana]